MKQRWFSSAARSSALRQHYGAPPDRSSRWWVGLLVGSTDFPYL
jgi:hypothetical protein